jgi:hypothetical protein
MSMQNVLGPNLVHDRAHGERSMQNVLVGL